MRTLAVAIALLAAGCVAPDEEASTGSGQPDAASDRTGAPAEVRQGRMPNPYSWFGQVEVCSGVWYELPDRGDACTGTSNWDRKTQEVPAGAANAWFVFNWTSNAASNEELVVRAFLGDEPPLDFRGASPLRVELEDLQGDELTFIVRQVHTQPVEVRNDPDLMYTAHGAFVTR